VCAASAVLLLLLLLLLWGQKSEAAHPPCWLVQTHDCRSSLFQHLQHKHIPQCKARRSLRLLEWPFDMG
jgi:hypothetical protein